MIPFSRSIAVALLLFELGATAEAGSFFRSVGKLNGKTIDKALRPTQAGPTVLPASGPAAKPVVIEDKNNVLSMHPDVPVVVDAKITSPGKATLTDVKLPEVGKWQSDLDTKVDPEKQASVARVTRAIEELDKASKAALWQGNYANAEGIVEKYGLLRDEIVEAYRNLPRKETGLRTLLASLYLNSKSGEKAWYGKDDNYRPDVYKRIFDRSRSCVAIVERGTTAPTGSGVLIARDLVLTANHVIQGAVSLDEFDVLFDFEEVDDDYKKQLAPGMIRRRVKQEAYFSGTYPDAESSKLDFTVLELEPLPRDGTAAFSTDDILEPSRLVEVLTHPSRSAAASVASSVSDQTRELLQDDDVAIQRKVAALVAEFNRLRGAALLESVLKKIVPAPETKVLAEQTPAGTELLRLNRLILEDALEFELRRHKKERPPLSLNVHRIKPETPIFLVGHPRQSPRMIHDNSWVKFPYIVSELEFDQLLVLVNGELAGSGGDAAAEADKFFKFYKGQKDKNGNKFYIYVNQRSGNAIHCMGAECDTFKGDSGAPALLRESGEVVGILIRGEPDQKPVAGEEGRVKSTAYAAGWIHHEKILPIVKVVEQLDQKKPGWRDRGFTIIE